jgi:maoC domain protein dehydratase
MLTASLCSTVAGMYLPGRYSLIHSLDEVSFMKPVFVGDTLSVHAEVVDKNESLKMIRIKVIIKNQENKNVFRAKMKVLLMK